MSELGRKPELKWININEMYVDPTYQRNTNSDASKKNLKYLTESFSWANCGALTVCYIDSKKKYAVLDGQHRMTAAMARGDIKELPCLVISNMDIKNQADSFLAINTKCVKISSLAAFHAAVAAGNQDAVAVKDLLDEINITIPNSVVSGSQIGPRSCQCVGSLIAMIGKYSKRQIQCALSAIPAAYGEEKGQIRAMLVKTLAEFLRIHPEATEDTLIQILEDIVPEDLEKDARNYIKINGGTSLAAMIVGLETRYKKICRRGSADITPPPELGEFSGLV